MKNNSQEKGKKPTYEFLDKDSDHADTSVSVSNTKMKTKKPQGKGLLNRLAEGSKDVREILHTAKDLAVIGAVAVATIFGVHACHKARNNTPEQAAQQAKVMQEKFDQHTEDKDKVRQTSWKLGGKFGGWLLKKLAEKNEK